MNRLLTVPLLIGAALLASRTPADELGRFERFTSFRIRGVCGGEHDLERLRSFGVNTIRGYAIYEPDSMRATLDRAHRLGMTVIVSEWMPHQGENKQPGKGSWNFDYETGGDALVERFVAKVEAIGDHPAILMWGLGNEVHVEERYLRVANRMSLAIHARFPNHVTSLTMVNAKPEAIAAVKKHAPDIDVLGIQSYSPGAVRGSIKSAEEHWGKPFYVSEFNAKGPWNFAKTEWGEAFDDPVPQKLLDLEACYEAIERSPLCLGSTIFLWAHTTEFRPTYFSLVLDPDPDGRANDAPASLLVTPQAELMAARFTGKPPSGNRAPVLSKLEFLGGNRSCVAAAGESIRVTFAADDPDGDRVEFVSWILEVTPTKRSRQIAGPFPAGAPGETTVAAPEKPGAYLLMVYALDGKGGGSASTLPFKVDHSPAPASARGP